jgi:hypothetical protein
MKSLYPSEVSWLLHDHKDVLAASYGPIPPLAMPILPGDRFQNPGHRIFLTEHLDVMGLLIPEIFPVGFCDSLRKVGEPAPAARYPAITGVVGDIIKGDQPEPPASLK